MFRTIFLALAFVTACAPETEESLTYDGAMAELDASAARTRDDIDARLDSADLRDDDREDLRDAYRDEVERVRDEAGDDVDRARDERAGDSRREEYARVVGDAEARNDDLRRDAERDVDEREDESRDESR